MPAGALWDGRWTTEGPKGTRVSALGEAGLAHVPDWRASGHTRAALIASPAFWQNDALLAAPFAMPREGCHAALRMGEDAIVAASHLR